MNRREVLDPDGGSLMVAVAIILILGLLGTVICARAVGAECCACNHSATA